MMTRLTLAFVALSGCSLVLDNSETQCSTDSDCEHFGNHPFCQEGLCVVSGLGPAGCFYGTPTTQDQFANQCTTSQSIAFDNCARAGLCDDTALQMAMSVSLPATQTVATTPVNNIPVPTINCATDVPNPIFITGSTNLPPLVKAVQPLLATGSPAYTAVFAPQTSCKGAASIYDLDPNKHKVTSVTNGTNNYPFFYDASGVQTYCLLDATGVTIDVGESDVYPSSCAYTPQSNVADYTGPIQAITFVVPAGSSQTAISAEAAHLVFAAGGDNGKIAPWTDSTLYFTRSSGTGTIQLPSRAIGLAPTAWWGEDRLSASNLVASMEAIDPNVAERAIGVLSSDFADRSRANLRTLAFQQSGQKFGYLPDSSPESFDKANVRDGHYPIWGQIHLIASTSGGIPSQAASALVTQFTVPKLDEGLVGAIISAGFVPPCAMKVTHTEEVGPLASYSPTFACSCYFDNRVNGATSCQTCAGPGECPSSAPACNYGYCEAQ
ncbi:MAG TPA: hypothetical protein VGO00_17825 [Kofleriaceae bacterium]|jgi:hypothetical protein|nr:hypothetical protein [Kofleriaceae bacterium]